MNNLLRSKKVLVRREFFGATLFDVFTGRRIYVDRNEFIEIKRNGLTKSLRKDVGIVDQECLIIEPKWLPKFNFSAPDTVFFEITRACNIKCSHCFNISGTKLDDEIPYEEKIRIIKDLWQTGVQEVRFTGGEPLVSQEICDLLSFSTNLGFRSSIGTNASLVTKDYSKQLASSGLHSAIVSVDGIGSVHDKIRGKGCFAKTMRGISFLQSSGISVRINTVVMRSSFEKTVSLVEYFFKQEIPVFLRRFIPVGRSNEAVNEILTRNEYIVLKNKLAPYLEDKSNLIQGHYLRESEIKARISLPFVRQKCSVGSRSLVILPNGKVQTCGFLSSLGEQHIGCVLKEPMRFIWKRLLTSEYVDSLCKNLAEYNAQTVGCRTNCFAIATAIKK